MTTWKLPVACALLAFASTAGADEAKKHKPTAKTEAVSINENDLAWSDAPPDLPKGAQLAVLYGDPAKKGLFTVRLKMPDGYKIPPHWHSQDEHLTILSGTLLMYMGDTMQSEPHTLEVGAYHFLPAKSHHAAEAKGTLVVQLHGMGPFDIHYINPADNPNPKTAKK